MGVFSKPGPDELLVAFVAHLVGAWAGLGNLLEIYSSQFSDMGKESQYVRVKLENILAASKQKLRLSSYPHHAIFLTPPKITTITTYGKRKRRDLRMGLK